MQILRHARAIALLPIMVTLVIPAILIHLTDSVNIGWSLSAPINLVPPSFGFFLIVFGLALMVKSITLFATIGKGTLAPWDPTQELVVHGAYLYVRNPMISGVFCVLLGEATLLGSLPLLYWFSFIFLLNLIYIPLFEEPNLTRRFGEDYIQYKRNVPRWIPRLTPWDVSLD